MSNSPINELICPQGFEESFFLELPLREQAFLVGRYTYNFEGKQLRAFMRVDHPRTYARIKKSVQEKIKHQKVNMT
jgi:hypothetical protein